MAAGREPPWLVRHRGLERLFSSFLMADGQAAICSPRWRGRVLSYPTFCQWKLRGEAIGCSLRSLGCKSEPCWGGGTI